MSVIYVTGHRNPDLDSLCAAIAYAELKNKVDPDNRYIPIYCSPVSDGVRKQMDCFGIDIPHYKKDVIPRVRDVMSEPRSFIQADDPIYRLVQTYSTDSPSVIPIYDDKDFRALLSIDDISSWFLRDNMGEAPTYQFKVENIHKVLPGRIVQKGSKNNIDASFVVGAADHETFLEYVEHGSDAVLFMGARIENIKAAIEGRVPAIIITACEKLPDIDFSSYDGLVYVTPITTAEAVRRMRMVESISDIVRDETVRVESDDLFEDAKSLLLNSSVRGLAVMDESEFVGFVTRANFLETPRTNIIMVDHNEARQSIKGIEEANLLEIIDHHRLDAMTTKLPIYIAAEPLGSTCTIILGQFRKNGVIPDRRIAKILLTGIIADTLMLKSPTTTAVDVAAVKELAWLARIDDVQAFGEKLFGVADNLATQDPLEKARSDFKTYDNNGISMGIGQCEVTTLSNLGEYAGKYIEAIETIRREQNLDWAMLMITDVLAERSVLLVTESKLNRNLPYAQLDKQVYDMPGVMSRKKQLLPTMLSMH